MRVKNWDYVQELALMFKSIEDYKKRLIYNPNKNVHGVNILINEQTEIINEIITKSVPFIYFVAGNLLNRGGHLIRVNGRDVKLSLKGINTTVDDLVSEGAIGIKKRIKKFNPEAGRISTYLSLISSVEMYKQGLNKSGIVYLPHDVIRKLRFLKSNYEKNYEIVDVLADNLNISSESAAIVNASYSNHFSEIDGPVSQYKKNSGKPESSTSYGEVFLEDDRDDNNLYKKTESNELCNKLNRIISELDNTRQRKIMELRFPLNGGKRHTLEEIGEVFNVTRARIEQIEKYVLRKIKPKAIREGLRDYHN